MRVALLSLAAACLGCGAREEGSTLDVVLRRGQLIVGLEPEFPPFESKNVQGEIVGFDVDLARELAQDLGVELRLEEMAWDSLPTALETGKIDVIISGMTATAERAKSRTFTDPYFHTKLCLLVGAKSGIEKPADVDGKRLAVKLGTTGDIQSTRLFPRAQIVRFDLESACALEVATGRADAFLYDRHSILRHHRNNPETTRAILEPLSEEPYSMAVRLGDTRFADRLNQFLRDVRADGRYARIHEFHFSERPEEPPAGMSVLHAVVGACLVLVLLFVLWTAVRGQVTGRELLVRTAITVAVAGLLVLALWRSPYRYDFRPTWPYRELYFVGLGKTLGATAIAYATGVVLGVGVAMLRVSRRLPLRHLGDLYVELVRGTPFIAQVTIAYFGIAPLLGLGNKFLIGTLALGVFAAAYLGEIFRAGIESVERGQVEAARSLGLSRTQALRHVVFPQAFKRMIPPLTGELIALTKESSLLFTIGVVEMNYVARQVGASTYRNFEAFLVVAAMYLTLTVPLSLLARKLERRLKRSERTGVHL